MKKVLILIALLTGIALNAYNDKNFNFQPGNIADQPNNGASVLQTAYNNRKSNLQVRGTGVVYRILPDDNKGSRHQRFLIRTDSGQSLLIAHNIDLAQKIRSLKNGDTIEFYGEYEWNPKGGVIHWTHHDPDGRHIGGWLKHHGKTYQ